MNSTEAFVLDADKLVAGRAASFGTLIAVAAANGFSERISSSVAEQGFLAALFGTFNVSVFVWLSLAGGLWLLYSAKPTEMNARDWLIVKGATMAILIPVPALSWLTITALSLLVTMHAMPADKERRGGMILLAMTIPAFWAGVVMSVFNDWILSIDARLVAFFLRTTPQGNLVPFADYSGALWIAPGCSSFANISLAILAIVAVVNITSGKWSWSSIALAASACVAVVLINTTRIGLIGYFPDKFALIHGEVGASIAGALSTLVILASSWLVVRRHA